MTSTGGPVFDEAFQAKFAELLIWRRDVRHFREGPAARGLHRAPLGAGLPCAFGWPLRALALRAGRGRRDAARRCAKTSSPPTPRRSPTYAGERAAIYTRLKLEGLDAAPVHLAVFTERDPEQGARLGRRTMPETVAYSAVSAIHTLWLAARTEGIGMGWVSILDPEPLNRDLGVPAHWQFIGYFCIGYPAFVQDTPELVQVHWEKRADPASLIFRR